MCRILCVGILRHTVYKSQNIKLNYIVTSLLEIVFRMPTLIMPTQYVSQYTSQYAYIVCLRMPTHSILPTVSYNRRSHITKFQNLKSQKIVLKYFMNNFLGNFFSTITHIMPTHHASQYASQYAYTVCLRMPTLILGRLVSICRSYPHRSVKQVESSLISLISPLV